MRLAQFDLNLLVAFEILLEEQSVTRAAERMNVTQSAMSAALKRLRESFQDDLLVLHGKKMIPTQHALNLAPEVSAILTRLKSLVATSTRFDPATSKRSFRISVSEYVTTVLIGRLIEFLDAEAPGIRLDLSLPNPQSNAKLESGEIDLLLTPEDFLLRDHPRELLFDEHHVIVGWRHNPAMNGPMTEDVFQGCGHVAVRISDKDSFIEAILAKLTPERRIEVFAQSFMQVPWLLRGTNRLSVMHERLAKITAPMFDLKIAKPPFPLPLMREMMQSHVTRTNDAGLAWLRERIREFAKMA